MTVIVRSYYLVTDKRAFVVWLPGYWQNLPFMSGCSTRPAMAVDIDTELDFKEESHAIHPLIQDVTSCNV